MTWQELIDYLKSEEVSRDRLTETITVKTDDGVKRQLYLVTADGALFFKINPYEPKV